MSNNDNINDRDYRWHDEGSIPQQKNLNKKEQSHVLDNEDNMSKDNLDALSPEQKQLISSNKTTEKQLLRQTTEKNSDIKKEQEFSLKEFGDAVRKLDKILSKVADNIQLIEDQRKRENIQKYTDQKGAEAISKGLINTKKYRNYYDVSKTIATAAPNNPNDFDSPVYQRERVFVDLQRIADKVQVTNEGPGILYMIVSHGGEVEFSQETPIFAGDTKWYYNVYELRVRSPTAGLGYRVTEYYIQASGSIGFIPADIADLHDVALPTANTNWLSSNLSPVSTPTNFRIQVAVSVSGNFSAAITNGGDTQVVTFNVVPGPALVADGLYIFNLLVHSGDTVNFRYSVTGGVIRILRAQEIDSTTA